MVPNKLLIGNIPYDVLVVNNLKSDEDEKLWGEIEYPKQQIRLEGCLKRDMQLRVLIHEITHGILEMGGLSKYNEEDIVDPLSAALYDFLTRNDLSFLKSSVVEKNDALDSLRYAAEQLGKTTALSASEVAGDLFQKVRLSSSPQSVSDDAKSRRRKLPINNERSLTVKLGDLQDVQYTKVDNEEPSHWKTGIKVKDGIKHYKTRYECACGNKGTHYVPEDVSHVNCHSCNEKMQKILATDKGFPHQDVWGNFFIAGEVDKFEEA